MADWMIQRDENGKQHIVPVQKESKTKKYYKKNKEQLLESKKFYYEKRQEHIKEVNKAYYESHKQELSHKARQRRMRKKIMESGCYWCHKEFNEPRKILRYHGKYFCDDECLGEYLVDKVEDEITDIDFDTAENIEICEKERWAEW